MTEFPSWHKSPSGELKHFTQGPVPDGWEPAGGHYDFALGVWIDDEAAPDIEPMHIAGPTEPADVIEPPKVEEPAEPKKPAKKPRKPRAKKGAK